MAVNIERGFDEHERVRVGELYWEAFGDKLSAAFRHAATGRDVVTAALRPDRVMVARDGAGPVGLCGFHEAGRGAAHATWAILRDHVGRLEALWALAALSILGRSEREGVLVLDGICVDRAHRGRGIGSALLDAVVEYARHRGLGAVQLSVIDANPRAAELYRRHGFAVVARGSLGPLRHLFGFDGYATMRRRVEA